MRPLEQIKEKNEEEYLLEGIDINDKEQKAAIERRKRLQKQNADNMDGSTRTHIRDLHGHHGDILRVIDFAQGSLASVLRNEREKTLKDVNVKFADIKEQLRLEAEKKKGD